MENEKAPEWGREELYIRVSISSIGFTDVVDECRWKEVLHGGDMKNIENWIKGIEKLFSNGHKLMLSPLTIEECGSVIT